MGGGGWGWVGEWVGGGFRSIGTFLHRQRKTIFHLFFFFRFLFYFSLLFFFLVRLFRFFSRFFWFSRCLQLQFFFNLPSNVPFLFQLGGYRVFRLPSFFFTEFLLSWKSRDWLTLAVTEFLPSFFFLPSFYCHRNHLNCLFTLPIKSEKKTNKQQQNKRRSRPTADGSLTNAMTRSH